MCVVRIAIRRGKSSEELDAISQAVYEALVHSYDMPAGDHFQIIQQLEPDEFRFDRNYLGGPRTDHFLMLNILGTERRPAAKQAFFKHVVELLEQRANIGRQDVFISLQAAPRTDWSFANGIALEK